MLWQHLARIFVLAFAVAVAASLYVHATTNALYDSYQPGIQGFKRPFTTVALAALSVPLSALVTGALLPSIRRKARRLIHDFGAAVLAVSLVVLLLGQAPCLRPHPTTEPHHTHHNLESVIERALLCPRYSNRSYPLILIWLCTGAGLLWVSRSSESAA